MAAGDRNRQQEREVSEQELSERRERFFLSVTQQEDGNRVAANREFLEFVKPDIGQNNEFIYRKFTSTDILGGERSPDFSSRQIICQRPISFLDPINKYYAMGSDKILSDKVNFTPLETNNAFSNRALSAEAPTSVNVNFNIGGYAYDGARTRIKGLNRGEVQDIEHARRGETRTGYNYSFRGFVYPANFPSGTSGPDPFNFFYEINALATAGQSEIFETLDDALRYFPRSSYRENGDLTKTVGGTRRPVRTQRGTTYLWEPSPRMNRILRLLRFDEYEDFEEEHPNFTLDDRDPGPYYTNARMFNNKPGPYRGFANTIHAVLLEIQTRYGDEKALEAAHRALTRQERINLSVAQEPVVYEFYDFETSTTYVKDPYTEVLSQAPGTRQAFDAGVAPGAYISAEYVYQLPGYEDSVANQSIPESALPNMYVYQLAAGSVDVDTPSGRLVSGWDSSPQGDEIRRGYDGLVRLGEFITGTLPALRAQQRGQGNSNIESYLLQYGRATRDTNVIIDMTSSIARRQYNQVTDTTSMNLYEQFNAYKTEFPMYIELGIPMVETGDLNDLVNASLGTTSIVNSILNTEPDGTIPFKTTTYGVKAPRGVLRLGNEDFDSTEREIEVVENREPRKVYNFDEWLSSTNAALRADDTAELSLNGPWAERNGGEAALSAWRRQISNLVRTQSREKMVMYKDFLEGKKSLCESETLMYKLVKYATSPTNPRQREVIQNYFFANTDEISMINFVDTQVKYGKYYQYELYAYDIVYGSKYLFRTRLANFPEARDTLIASNNGEGGTLAFYSFNVDTQPNVKIVEYPINVFDWRQKVGPRRTQLGSYAVPAVNSRPDLTVGGVSYPISRVQDYPPVTPEGSILSFKDTNNKVLINLSPGVGEYLEQDALKYIAFDAEEEQELSEIAAGQRTSGLQQSTGKISYREQKGAVKMLIYRTDFIDTTVAKREDLYKSFSGNLHKTLEVGDLASPANKALAYDFMDEIEPNKKYYYTFRSENVRDQMSNPGPIYEVELRVQDGFYTPVIQEYIPQITTAKMPSKKMVRFLEIKGSDLQVLPFNEVSQNSGFADSRTGLFAAEKSLIPQVGNDGILGNKFVVRITSRDTGRKVNVVIDFQSTENR